MEFEKEKTHIFPHIYIGQVEDIDDPENRGRVRVRVTGLHGEKANETNKILQDSIPTDHLPFAEQCASIFGGFHTDKEGIHTVPSLNSWVFLFFVNGDTNLPVYFGSIIGNNNFISNSDAPDELTTLKTKSGHTIEFNDTDGKEKITITSKGGNIIDINDEDENIVVKDKNDHKITIDSNGIEINSSDSTEKMVLGETLNTYLSNLENAINTLKTTMDTRIATSTYIAPLIPSSPTPIIPTSQSTFNSPTRNILSDKNKND